MNIRVRPATDADIDWLATQLREFSAQYGTKIEPFPDEDVARAWIHKMIREQVFLVADGYRDHERVGFIAGLIGSHLYNPRIRVLNELFWWVVPEHRGGPAAARLIDEFTTYGRANADWITFGTTKDTPIKDETLVKRGFVLREKAFMLEVD